MRAARLERLRVAQEAAEAAQKAGSEDNPESPARGHLRRDDDGQTPAAELKGARGCRGPDMTLSWEWLDDGDGQLTCDEFVTARSVLT